MSLKLLRIAAFLLLFLSFSTSAIKTKTRTQQRLQPSPISGIKTLLENNPSSSIVNFIAARAASTPNAQTLSTLLSEMADQYQEELTQITSSMLANDELCEIAKSSYSLSVQVRQEYIGVVGDSLEDINEEIDYYTTTISGLENIQETIPQTVTNLNTLLASTDSQCSIMMEILQTTDDQLEELVETVVTLEPTSLTTVNTPGQFSEDFVQKKQSNMNNLLQEKARKVEQLKAGVENLVQFSQADLSMAYNYLKQLQSSVETAIETYDSRAQFSQVGSGTLLAAVSQLGDEISQNLVTLTQEKTHLNSMSESYVLVEDLVSSSIDRYEALEAAEEASCNCYQEESETLASTIQEGLSMIQELQTAIMTDYENLQYYLKEFTN